MPISGLPRRRRIYDALSETVIATGTATAIAIAGCVVVNVFGGEWKN
jgi:hypothetical protein